MQKSLMQKNTLWPKECAERIKTSKNIVIGFDLDDVISSFVSSLIKYQNATQGTNLRTSSFNSYNLWETYGGTREDHIKLVYEFYETRQFRNMSLVKGAKEGITLLSEFYNLVIITSRPYDKTEETTAWLNNHFPGAFSGINFTNTWSKLDGLKRTKSEICLEINAAIIVEDCISYAADCAGKGIPALLFDHNKKYGWNQAEPLPDGVRRVHSWDEIVEEVLKLE